VLVLGCSFGIGLRLLCKCHLNHLPTHSIGRVSLPSVSFHSKKSLLNQLIFTGWCFVKVYGQIKLGPDLQNILRLSYDNAKVTIDLRRTSNLQNILTKGARLFLGTIHLQSCKIVRDTVHKLAYHVPKRNLSTF